MADNDRSVFRTSDGKWANKRHGASRPSTKHDTQRAAEFKAREMLTRSGGGELNTHGLNGKIRSKDTIAKKDPFPPTDREQ